MLLLQSLQKIFTYFPEITMDTSTHSIETLFYQLGLEGDEEQISAFIEKHRPLPAHIVLHEAYFWNDAQVAFLIEAIEDDSDWCEFVDQLDCLLRES